MHFASMVLIATLKCNENVFVKIYIFVCFLLLPSSDALPEIVQL